MNEVIEKNNIKLESLIYEIRGKQVMLDSDLAKLYQCINGTKDINKAVNRNINRFPKDFYFQLTMEEVKKISKFQNGTLKIERGKNVKYLPHLSTEQGVAMLSSVLRTDIASKISIKIMRAFVAMRCYISNNLLEQNYINELVLKDNKRIDLLENTFNSFKDLGKKCFAINKIEDISIIKNIIEEVNGYEK